MVLPCVYTHSLIDEICPVNVPSDVALFREQCHLVFQPHIEPTCGAKFVPVPVFEDGPDVVASHNSNCGSLRFGCSITTLAVTCCSSLPTSVKYN